MFLVGGMVYADDVALIVPLLASLPGVVTDEGAVGGRCEEDILELKSRQEYNLFSGQFSSGFLIVIYQCYGIYSYQAR